MVRLPTKGNVTELGKSYSRALKRFYALERSLNKQPDLKMQYTEFLKDYEDLGHMTEIASDSFSDGYFLPHHPVIKKSSLTTKLRVVFDASAKTSTGISLNDVLMVGPNLQDDLFSLLVRFRSHVYAITADITKMYRQIELHPDDRKFLWRENCDQPIKIFALNTVTYGTASASFLATRSLIQLANDVQESYPNAATALKEDFYVDDLVSGKREFNEAKNLVNDLISVSEYGAMPLRQWASNEPDLISDLSKESNDTHICLNFGETTKRLGIYWNPRSDSLKYSVTKSNIDTSVTKRTILSQIAQLFDPLGLLGPVILQAKIMMQSLWLLELDWDESVPQQVYTAWSDFQNQLPLLHELNIDRKIVLNDYSRLEMHGFCDASEKAYGACVYLRSINNQGKVDTHLICSKSRVAPLKNLTLPRLELCAALLLCNLFKSTSHALRRLTVQRVIFWSDSTIALHWIKSPPHTLKTFESNRVAKIQEISNQYEWRHVRTEHNPADLVSRGLSPREIIQNSFWFNGPLWINDHDENWPISIVGSKPASGIEKVTVNLTCKGKNKVERENCENEFANDLFKLSSSFLKLLRIIAYCQRFINIKVRNQVLVGSLSPDELKKSEICLMRLTQQATFPDEIKDLKLKGSINGKLSPLSPFLDSKGILRVGGRLNQSDLNYDRKHPILLIKNHIVTNLIIRDQHLKSLHAGTQATLNAIRSNYWIIDGKNAVKN
ncbi:uncharacterized protein LOC127278878 [Leptopilina boulardi]|uniref:uncharacterized protein LOC127278878 n=1 Tax=Leptopilina boulardi TaxID=63433 RepID=UPI0021F63679|nr:uncharacterized protein LOC127278878 [Leptopilina boulardi]